MACIIKMTSDELLDKFIKKFDYKKFNFLLISEDIKTVNKYRNVYELKSLIPPANIMSRYIQRGYTKSYVEDYVDYISTPRVEAMITVMVKLAIVENSNVVLLCSKAEDEYRYIDIICQYINEVYGAKTYSYKEYKKDPENCEAVSNKTKKKILKVLESKISDMADLEKSRMPKKEVRKQVKEMSRKDMKKFLRMKGIKHDSKASKKELRKQIVSLYESGELM